MLAELTQSEIEEVLANNYVGRIGCKDDDTVYIIPVNYRFKEGYAECYSLVGDKVRMMREHPEVCFEVEQIRDSAHWKTVICWGVYEEVTDNAELELLRPEYTEHFLRLRTTLSVPSPAESPAPKRTEGELSPPVIYRIRFSKWSGRMHEGFSATF